LLRPAALKLSGAFLDICHLQFLQPGAFRLFVRNAVVTINAGLALGVAFWAAGFEFIIHLVFLSISRNPFRINAVDFVLLFFFL
jgi:hypothetical protein